jgi:hypothetical protein
MSNWTRLYDFLEQEDTGTKKNTKVSKFPGVVFRRLYSSIEVHHSAAPPRHPSAVRHGVMYGTSEP